MNGLSKGNMVLNVKRRLFLFNSGMFLLFLFVFPANAKSLMNNILSSLRESQELDKEIIKKMRFELLDNQLLEGSTEKYLLKSNNGDVWLFKSYSRAREIKVSRSVYLFAQLLGISTPILCEISLPINGKITRGSIQEFISGSIELDKDIISKLNDKLIMQILQHQIFDWLIFDEDSTLSHCIFKIKTKEIILVDKDAALNKIGIASLEEYLLLHHGDFWDAYIEGVIDIDLRKTFDFINHIRSINNCEFRKILPSFLNEDELMNEFFLRKKNLKGNFGKFCHKIYALRGKRFKSPFKTNGKKYSKFVLKKLKKSVLKKKKMLKNLEGQTNIKQKDIVVISSGEAWFAVETLNYSARKKFFLYAKDTLEKLKYLEKNTLNVCEKLAVNVYTEEVKRAQKGKDIKNFVQRKIERIVMHPDQLTNCKISGIEYNLRTIYGEDKKPFSECRVEIERKSNNLLMYLDYFWYPIAEVGSENMDVILRELNKDPTDFIYKVLYGILLKDIHYLEKIDDKINWKYFGMALVGGRIKDKYRAIKCCNQAVSVNENKFVIYLIHMLAGFIYQHNNQWERFGEGFELEKAVEEYKKAIKINPCSVKAHLNLGVLYLRGGEAYKALNEFEKIKKLDFEYAKKHFHFDKIKEESYYKSKDEYLRAIRMNTLSGRHNYVLGLAWVIMGNEKLAKEHFDKAREFGYKFDNKL